MDAAAEQEEHGYYHSQGKRQLGELGHMGLGYGADSREQPWRRRRAGN